MRGKRCHRIPSASRTWSPSASCLLQHVPLEWLIFHSRLAQHADLDETAEVLAQEWCILKTTRRDLADHTKSKKKKFGFDRVFIVKRWSACELAGSSRRLARSSSKGEPNRSSDLRLQRWLFHFPCTICRYICQVIDHMLDFI